MYSYDAKGWTWNKNSELKKVKDVKTSASKELTFGNFQKCVNQGKKN